MTSKVPMRWVAGWLLCAAANVPASEIMSAYAEDVERFTRLLNSPVPERQVEGIQGLSFLKHWPAETQIVALLTNAAPAVRREALAALARIGTGRSVPVLIQMLSAPEWEARQTAADSLRRITGQTLPTESPEAWEAWWKTTALPRERRWLLAQLSTATNASPGQRGQWLAALSRLAEPEDEEACLQMLPRLSQAHPDPAEIRLVGELLERIGTARSLPVLTALRTEEAAWALGRIGGAEAERALLGWPRNLTVLINLDRLHSTNTGPWAAWLIRQMGLVTYRGQPDDLFHDEPQPIQRVAANLILRSGQGPALVEVILRELEETMEPPLARGPRPAMTPDIAQLMAEMREELKPGFVRNDGVTTAQPLTALSFMARDRALIPRLLPLLRHPAFVARIYVAMTLGRLRAHEATPALLAVIREGYNFADATALASGKHFDQSQTVRWRGFLCLALGRIGGEEARTALEQIATDPNAYRDLRYGAVIGLRFTASPQSLPALRHAASHDIIWMVRDAAREAALHIETLAREGEAARQATAKP